MKKFCISLICLSIIILTIVLSSAIGPNEEYLRIHIRANSNSESDQSVKYVVRDAIVNYLTPVVAAANSKDELQKSLKSHIIGMEAVADEVLSERGFGYRSDIRLTAEEFPTRVYEDVTLEAGYYDALIVDLGTGEGDNWWCVVYPPLCFTGSKGGDFTYRSKIYEIIAEWRASRG